MEKLLHYVWKHKIFLHSTLHTTDGSEVEVISPGMHNTDSGPDFSGAKVKIDGVLWVGNVEIHVRTSDWFRHHHDGDRAYDNIILHVVAEADAPLLYPNGKPVPQLVVQVPPYIRESYDSLIKSDQQPRCAAVVSTLPTITVHNWLTSLMLERFESRARQLMQRCEALEHDWERTLFVTVARNFGFGINGDAFEAWAKSIPWGGIAKHRDNLFQIEAIFFGQAGLLETEADGDEYASQLRREYAYLRQKFSLMPIDIKLWRFLRLRPQNFPHIRIAQLAMLYYEQRLTLARLIGAQSLDDVQALFTTHVSDFWRTHYTFASEPHLPTDKVLSKPSLQLLIINSVAPMLFAYGKYKSDEDLRERAFELWQALPPENNRITRDWAAANVECESAADSQALIQLAHAYCDTHDCLRCKFGYEFVKNTPSLLCEASNEGEAIQTEIG